MPDFRIHNLTPIPALDLTVSTEFVANSPTTTSLRAARAGDREHQLLSNEEYRSQGDKRSIIQICHTIQNSQCCKSGEGWSIGVSPDQWNNHVNNYGVNDVSDQCFSDYFSDYFSDCFSVHCTVIISDSPNDQNTQSSSWSNRGHHKHTSHQRVSILQKLDKRALIVLFFVISKVHTKGRYKKKNMKIIWEKLPRDKQRHLAGLDWVIPPPPGHD